MCVDRKRQNTGQDSHRLVFDSAAVRAVCLMYMRSGKSLEKIHISFVSSRIHLSVYMMRKTLGKIHIDFVFDSAAVRAVGPLY